MWYINIKSERNMKGVIIAILVIVCVLLILGIIAWSYLRYNSMGTSKYWNLKVNKFNDETPMLKEGQIVFFGDSLTDLCNLNNYYPQMLTINRGISGDTSHGVLLRLSEIVALKPSKVVLLIGTNDILYGKPIKSTISNIRKILTRLLSETSAKLYVESVYPLGMFRKRFNNKVIKLNALIKNLCKELNITYINLYPLLLNAEKSGLNTKFSVDGIHLNKHGYEKITPLISKYLNDK